MNTVPVEVTVVLHIDEEGWCEEHGAEGDFKNAVRDWFRDEQVAMIEGGDWMNVHGVDLHG
jgi:hypothetical protein